MYQVETWLPMSAISLLGNSTENLPEFSGGQTMLRHVDMDRSRTSHRNRCGKWVCPGMSRYVHVDFVEGSLVKKLPSYGVSPPPPRPRPPPPPPPPPHLTTPHHNITTSPQNCAYSIGKLFPWLIGSFTPPETSYPGLPGFICKIIKHLTGLSCIRTTISSICDHPEQ